MYSNDSYIMERGYEQAYERSETISQPKDCGHCKGEGKEYFSKCCGKDIHMGICQECGGSTVEESDDCEVCLGEGVIYE